MKKKIDIIEDIGVGVDQCQLQEREEEELDDKNGEYDQSENKQDR